MSDYPKHPTVPEQRIILAPTSGRNVERDAETFMGCPWCERYGGHGAVPASVRAEWRATYPELRAEPGAAVVDDTEDDPPTTFRPLPSTDDEP